MGNANYDGLGLGMGMDSVELLEALEESFDIVITDELAETLHKLTPETRFVDDLNID